MDRDLPHRQCWLSAGEEHSYIAPGAGDVRSPCPALNTLANHGYINRTGKKISPSSLISALTSIYHLSTPLATTLVTGGVFCCGDLFAGISLDILAAHNKIEHDASLVHDNAPLGAKYAPTEVNYTLLEELIERYPRGMGLNDLADARFHREMMLRKEGRHKLDDFHEEVGHGEAALTWLLMKETTDVVSIEAIRQWFGEETFPESYVIPKEEISLEKVMDVSAEIGRDMKRIEGK